jgi:hypothetical protein
MKFVKQILVERHERRERKAIPIVSGGSASFKDWIRDHEVDESVGILYLIESEVNDSFKIGVTRKNSRSDRVEQHLRQGWKPIQSWIVSSFAEAEAIEQTVIEWWRSRGFRPSVDPAVMPQGGSTETVNRQCLEISDIVDFVESQVLRGIIRPSIGSTTSNLTLGVRSMVRGKVGQSRLDIRRVGSYKGHPKYSGVYRYVVKDDQGTVSVESYAGRKSPTDNRLHLRIPLPGLRVVVEGRPRRTFSEEVPFGFINPLVVAENEADESVRATSGSCGICKIGRLRFDSGSRNNAAHWICISCRKSSLQIDTGVWCGACNRSTYRLIACNWRTRQGIHHRFAKAACAKCDIRIPHRWFL